MGKGIGSVLLTITFVIQQREVLGLRRYCVEEHMVLVSVSCLWARAKGQQDGPGRTTRAGVLAPQARGEPQLCSGFPAYQGSVQMTTLQAALAPGPGIRAAA